MTSLLPSTSTSLSLSPPTTMILLISIYITLIKRIICSSRNYSFKWGCMVLNNSIESCWVRRSFTYLWGNSPALLWTSLICPGAVLRMRAGGSWRVPSRRVRWDAARWRWAHTPARGTPPASGWVGGWVSEWMSEWMNEWMNGWMDEWMSEWVNEWMNEWMNEWVNEWMSEWMKVSMIERKFKGIQRREKYE